MDAIARGELCTMPGEDGYETVAIEYHVGIGLDAGRGRFKPKSWSEGSARAAPGEIQNMLQELNQARLEYEMAILAYENQAKKINGMQKKIKERAQYLSDIRGLKHSERWAVYLIDYAVRAVKATAKLVRAFGTTTKDFSDASSKCPPQAVGLANDVGAVPRCTFTLAGSGLSETAKLSALALDFVVEDLGLVKDTTKAAIETAILEVSSDYDLAQYGKAMGGLLREERELRLSVYLAKDRVNGAQGNYDQTLQRGFRKLHELSRLRKRWAGQISEQRYYDMAYRIFQNDALQKYRQQFDMAQTYTYLTAAAYDYETNLSGDDPANGDKFLRDIVGQRTLGEVRRLTSPAVGACRRFWRPGRTPGADEREFQDTQGPNGLQQPAVRGQSFLPAARTLPPAR